MTQRFFSLLFMVCMFLCKTWAADSYVLDKELTWDQVKGGTTAFALVLGTNVLYGSGAQNTGMQPEDIALSGENGVSLWKAETVSNGFLFRGYNTAGIAYSVWGEEGYLNAQSSQTGVSFILGKTEKNNGKDIDNGAVWTVTSTTGGYYIKNVGNSAYLNGTNTSATADKVWKFYSVKKDANALPSIHRSGKNLVYDDGTSVVLHGVMDTPSAYFQAGRWTNGVTWADYNDLSNITPCLNYFTKVFDAITNKERGTYCNLFRLHLDPCWLQGTTLATGFNETNGKIYDPHGNEVSGEANIGKFSEEKFKARLQDLYIPIIKDAIAHGLYVIVRPPGVFPHEIVVGDYYNEYLKNIWDIISKDAYIKAHAGQVSLELGNEPVHIWEAGTTDFTQNYYLYDINRTNLYDFFQPIVDKIRNNGFNGIIWAPGTGYQAEYRGYAKKMITDSKNNFGFAAHFYPGWYNTTSNDETCKNTDANVLSTFKTQIPVQANYPIVITEVDWRPKDGTSGHYDEHGNWVVSNYGTWGTGSTTTKSRFGEQYKYVMDQCGNISWTIEGADLYVDMDAYLADQTIKPAFLSKATANSVDIYEVCSGAAFKWFREYVGGTAEWSPSAPSDIPTEGDLTASMFHEWDGVGADATILSTPTSEYNLGSSVNAVYGFSNVSHTHYADLSEYATLSVTATDGTPRFFINQKIKDGTAPDNMIQIPSNAEQTAKYQTVVDNGDGSKTYNIDLQAIVADQGYAHLNSIKAELYNTNVTVTSMKAYPIDNCLRITTPEAKENVWDWQVRYPLPAALATGKTYTIEIVAKAANETSVGVWPTLLSDSSNPQYASINVTNEWSTKSFDTNGTKAYDYLFFNVGKVNGDFMISNIKITDKSTGVVVLNNTMDDNATWTKTQSVLELSTVSSTTVADLAPEEENLPETVEEHYTASTYGRRPIDNKHPMWLVHVDVWNQADPQKIIDLIPEDIKPYVVMNLSLSCSYDKENDIYKRGQNAISTFKSWGSVCQQNGMWFTCQPASGGHTHIMDDDLETFEYFFKAYPNFLGWNYAEQFWGFNEAGDKSSTTEETRIDLFAKLIPMHHQYGGFLTISFCGMESSHALNPQGMLKRNANLLKASEDYPDAILWLYKYTHPKDFYNNESVTFGPFVAGLAKNYGVRYDNCGYNDAIEHLYGEESGIKYPTAAGIGTVMEQMAQNGGAVWDGPELIWTEDFQNLANSTVNGYTQRNWGTFPGFRNIWIDMFRKVIDGTIYIPTQKEVQEKTKIAIINDVTSGSNEDKYATWADLYDNIYKVDDPLNTTKVNTNVGVGQFDNNLSYQKSSGRYGTIPMMPELYTADAKAIPTQVRKSQRTTVWADLAAKKAAFDAAYPEVSTGDLFVSRYKNQLVTYNPYSNLGKTSTNQRGASANVPLKYNTCQSMDLTWANYSSAIVKEHRERIDFYLNNYRTDTTTTVVDRIVINGASSKPSYTMTKREEAVATATETWSGNVYTLEIDHMGPVDLTINCAGSAKGRSTNIVSDAALSTYNMPTQPAKFVGTIIKEAEDMNYKSIAGCIDNYYYQDKTIRGHSGNGIVKMGTNTAGGLTTNVKANSTESYNVTVRYTNSSNAGNVSLSVGSATKSLALETTAKNEWKKATVAFDFTEGNNTFKLDNTNGLDLWIDHVAFTPARIAAEEFDIVVKTAEGGTVTSDVAKATEGTKVTLTVTPTTGYALNGWTMGKTKVNIIKNANGTYSFTMPDNVVSLTPVFKDITTVYELDIPSTVNSSLPEGWRTTEGDEEREYGNIYNSGPRIFTAFTGDYTHALYWRSLNAGSCSADYGKLNDYPLNLKAGTYRLSYRMAAWKGSPQYKAQILNADESVLKTSDNITATSNANGSNTADLSATAEQTLEFRVSEKGNYVINFTATGGEFLLLSCRLNYLSIDPGQDDPDPEEFSFDDFTTTGSATFNRDTHEYTGSGTGGWTFDTPKDVSAYKYLVITSAQNRNNCKTSTKIALTFNDLEINGETNGNEEFTEKGKQLWLDNWNHNNVIVVNLSKLKDGGYDITKLNSVKFNLWGDTTDKFYPSNVYLTNTLPNFADGDFKNNIKVANKFGTICLPYAAACSGAKVYKVTGKKNGSLYMSRVDGLMEAGKAYFYCSTENYEGYQAEANYNVYFYKASDVTVDAPIINNGMVGTFVRMQPPKNSNAYILSSNQLYYVDSDVNVGANKAYIDMSQVPDLSPSAAAKSIKMSFFGGDRAVTDVNDDGATNIDDVTEVISIICSPTEQNDFGDVNGDGRIDIDDVTYIINSICNNN